jgi:hypothetical protein
MPSLVPRIPIDTAFWFLPFTHYKEAVLRSLATPTSSYKRFDSLRSDQPEIALPRIESKQAFKKAFLSFPLRWCEPIRPSDMRQKGIAYIRGDLSSLIYSVSREGECGFSGALKISVKKPSFIPSLEAKSLETMNFLFL